MVKKLSGVWITGGSSGIGKAAAKEFARTGSRVFVSARRTRELEKLNEEIEKEKLSVTCFPCNVGSSANVEQTIKKIFAIQPVDCLINNAGITSFKAAEDNSINEINDIILTNLLGSIYTIKFLLPYFIKQGKGTIINIISSAADKIFTNSSAYTASKAGLMGYANVLREEVRKYNIKVINILPGATETAMWPSEVRKANSERMMTAEEIARLLVWVYLQEGNMIPEEIIIKPIQGDL
jgi:3-oxoacyl-[acyl-carrier protein] reductase